MTRLQSHALACGFSPPPASVPTALRHWGSLYAKSREDVGMPSVAPALRFQGCGPSSWAGWGAQR